MTVETVYSYDIVSLYIFLYLYNVIKRLYCTTFNGKIIILVKIEITKNVNVFKSCFQGMIQTALIIVITVVHNFNKHTVNDIQMNLAMYYTWNINRNDKRIEL